MNNSKMILCRDINGDVHIVNKSDLIQRTSVYGVIQNDNGVLLVRDRTRTDKKWDLPGGGINPNEDPLAALYREIKEETDLDIVGDPKKVCEFTEYFFEIESQEGWESTRHFYKIATNGSPHMNGNEDDITEARYLKNPLSTNEVAPVARRIVAMANTI